MKEIEVSKGYTSHVRGRAREVAQRENAGVYAQTREFCFHIPRQSLWPKLAVSS